MNNRDWAGQGTSELKNIIEAALLAAGYSLSVNKLKTLFPVAAQPSTEQIKQALAILTTEYDDRGIELRRIGKGYRFQSREKYAPWLRKLDEGKPPRYSRALLETLAIVAYRQPVSRGDIEEIRGVGVSSDIMRTLLNRGWIRETGFRDVPGHPALFGTTPGFLEYFNLKNLSELPALKDKREPAEVAKELNLRLPLEGGEPDLEEQTMEELATSAASRHSAEIIPLDSTEKSSLDSESASDAELDAGLDLESGRETT